MELLKDVRLQRSIDIDEDSSVGCNCGVEADSDCAVGDVGG